MSGYEKYVEQAARAMHRERFGPDIPWGEFGPVMEEMERADVRAVLAVVGPLIEEDTLDRMVTAAGRALEREAPMTPVVTSAVPIIICEPRADCADPNVNRWHCMRGHDGAADGVCPLDHCERQGANR